MKKHLTPLKAIRKKCLDCSCWQPKEVKLCSLTECPLYVFRFGKNPTRSGIGYPSRLFPKKTAVERSNFFEEGGLKDA